MDKQWAAEVGDLSTATGAPGETEAAENLGSA